MTSEGLRFAVFGGPRVWRDGVELDLGPPQRRLLLTLLMLAGGDAVSTDLVVETLWEDDPPGTALNVVHRHVGQLRRTLEPELTSRQPGSYVAAAGNGYRLVSQRRATSTCWSCGCSCPVIATGRGRSSARPRRWPRRCRRRHDADHGVSAGSDRGGSGGGRAGGRRARRMPCVTSMRPDGCCQRSRRSRHDHPFDEPLQAALIRTLVVAGRRADALAHFGTVRALMDEELGLEPGPELQAAQQVALLEPGARSATGALRDAARSPRQASGDLRSCRCTRCGSSAGRPSSPTWWAGCVIPPPVRPCALSPAWAASARRPLARQCAQDVLDAYPDGQLYVNLHGYDAEVGPDRAGRRPAQLSGRAGSRPDGAAHRPRRSGGPLP